MRNRSWVLRRKVVDTAGFFSPAATRNSSTGRGRADARRRPSDGFVRFARGSFGRHARPVGREPAGLDRIAHLPHELQVVEEVVQGVEPGTQDLVGAMEVVQVPTREVLAGIAGAPG